MRLRGKTTATYRWRLLQLRWLAQFGRTRWPRARVAHRERPHVGIVVVSYNTRALTAHLVFSLYHLLGPTEFQRLVVVDNASTDGSRELLDALHEARLIHLIQNATQRYHAPALNQGISWLARQQRRDHPSRRLDYVWILDSDVVVLRHDTIEQAISVLARTGSAILGQKSGNPDELRPNGSPFISTCSMMIDPARVWKPPVPPFTNDGAPWAAMELYADRHGLDPLVFPFTEDGYLLHLGRGTLRAIAEAHDTTNRFYEWAVDHTEPHFGGMKDGAEVYGRFLELFDREVGALTPERLVEACKRSVEASAAPRTVPADS